LHMIKYEVIYWMNPRSYKNRESHVFWIAVAINMAIVSRRDATSRKRDAKRYLGKILFSVFMLSNTLMSVSVTKTEHKGWGIGVYRDNTVNVSSVWKDTPIPCLLLNSVCTFNTEAIHK